MWKLAALMDRYLTPPELSCKKSYNLLCDYIFLPYCKNYIRFRKNWFAGYQTAFDIALSKITQSNFAVAFVKDDFALHALVYAKSCTTCNMFHKVFRFSKNTTEFRGSVYHRVHEDLELAAIVNWKTNEREPRFDMGVKYIVSNSTVIWAKINWDSQLFLSLKQKLAPSMYDKLRYFFLIPHACLFFCVRIVSYCINPTELTIVNRSWA